MSKNVRSTNLCWVEWHSCAFSLNLLFPHALQMIFAMVWDLRQVHLK